MHRRKRHVQKTYSFSLAAMSASPRMERSKIRNVDHESRSLSPSRTCTRIRKDQSEDDYSTICRTFPKEEMFDDCTTVIVIPPSSSSQLELSRSAELNNRSQDHEDDNDSSSTSSSSSSEHPPLADPGDMKYSLSSNLLFLLGAALQTYIAAWDLVAAKKEETSADEKDDDQRSLVTDDEKGNSETSGFYQVLNSLGPFLYILNAFVDVWWALASSRCFLSSSLRNLSFVQFMQIGSQSGNVHLDYDTINQIWDLNIAVFFGIGAILEFYSTFFDEDDIRARRYTTGYYINMVSMHTYLISGLLAAQKDRALLCTIARSPARCFVSLGILLFLMGSILDCVISYLYDPELQSENIISKVTLAACNFSSSALWFADAFFYVWADCLIFGVFSKMILKYRAAKQWARKRTMARSEREYSSQLSMPLIEEQNDLDRDYED